VNAFKQTLLRARSIGIQSTSAIYLKTRVFPQLGIAGALADKLSDAGAAEVVSRVGKGHFRGREDRDDAAGVAVTAIKNGTESHSHADMKSAITMPLGSPTLLSPSVNMPLNWRAFRWFSLGEFRPHFPQFRPRNPGEIHGALTTEYLTL